MSLFKVRKRSNVWHGMHFVWFSMWDGFFSPRVLRNPSRILYTSRHINHAKYTAQSWISWKPCDMDLFKSQTYARTLNLTFGLPHQCPLALFKPHTNNMLCSYWQSFHGIDKPRSWKEKYYITTQLYYIVIYFPCMCIVWLLVGTAQISWYTNLFIMWLCINLLILNS